MEIPTMIKLKKLKKIKNKNVSIVMDRKEYFKLYRENNKEQIAAKNKEYRKTDKGKKYSTIATWKYRGLIHDNYEKLYIDYINTLECNVCKIEFTDKNVKCMDHNHNTGLFRYILCNNCNVMDNWRKKIYI